MSAPAPAVDVAPAPPARRRSGFTWPWMLLAVGVGLLAFGLWLVYRRRPVSAVAAVVAGAGGVALYLVTDTVPGDFTVMTPYITTLLVLALASQSLRMPAADGMRYRRGQAG
jgi:general nucleoside transport system permease protein